MFGRRSTPSSGNAPRDVPNPKPKGYFEDDRPWALPTRDQESDARYENTKNTYRDHTSHNPIRAAKGYHGTVRRPTYFLAGERGPESVNITPQKHVHKKHYTKGFSIWDNNLGKKKNFLKF